MQLKGSCHCGAVKIRLQSDLLVLSKQSIADQGIDEPHGSYRARSRRPGPTPKAVGRRRMFCAAVATKTI